MTMSIYELHAGASTCCSEALSLFRTPGVQPKIQAIGYLALARLASLGATVKGAMDVVARSWKRAGKIAIVLMHGRWSAEAVARTGVAAVLAVSLLALRVLCSLQGVITPELTFGLLRVHRLLLFLGLIYKVQIDSSAVPTGNGRPRTWFHAISADQTHRWNIVMQAMRQIDDTGADRSGTDGLKVIWLRAIAEVQQRARAALPHIEEPRRSVGHDDTVLRVPATPSPVGDMAAALRGGAGLPFDDEDDVAMVPQEHHFFEFVDDSEDEIEEGDLARVVADRGDDVMNRPDVVAALAGDFGRPVQVAHPILEAFHRRFIAGVRAEALAVHQQRLYTKDEVEDMTTAYLAVMHRATLRTITTSLRVIHRELLLADREATRTDLALRDGRQLAHIDVLLRDGETATVQEERLCNGRILRTLPNCHLAPLRRRERVVMLSSDHMEIADIVDIDGRKVEGRAAGGLEEWQSQILEILLLFQEMSATDQMALASYLCADEERVRNARPDLPPLSSRPIFDRCFKLVGELYTTFLAHHMPADTHALQEAFSLP